MQFGRKSKRTGKRFAASEQRKPIFEAKDRRNDV